MHRAPDRCVYALCPLATGCHTIDYLLTLPFSHAADGWQGHQRAGGAKGYTSTQGWHHDAVQAPLLMHQGNHVQAGSDAEQRGFINGALTAPGIMHVLQGSARERLWQTQIVAWTDCNDNLAFM